MKFTQVLLKHHLGRMTKFNWFQHAKQVPYDTGANAYLAEKGVKVVDVQDILAPKVNLPKIQNLFDKLLVPFPQAQDNTHPNWHEKPCLKFNTNDLLVQGIEQAQALTKTSLLKDGLPDQLDALIEDQSDKINQIVQNIIGTSNIFDPHQETLPKLKDPLRPAWNFPREYGITASRKADNLSQRLIQLCDIICGPTVAQHRQLVRSSVVQVPVEKENDLLLMNMTIDFMVVAKKSLPVMASLENIKDSFLPDLHPMTPTVGLQTHNIYNPVLLYPVSKKSSWIHPHTIFFYHDPDRVKNFTELPVSENQLLSRSLIKAFTAAAGCAQQKYGNDVKDLPEPMTVQCIQSNGQSFHFSVFQLNTLNLDGRDGKTNFWWSLPQIDLFDKAKYQNGKPVLEGYNPEVFKRILAFYRNA